MKHIIEITTVEWMMLRNAIWYYIHEASAHPIDKETLESASERINRTIANDLSDKVEAVMTNEIAIKILKHRTECGKADTIKCIQTGCENCDLFYKEENLAEASTIAIKALEKRISRKCRDIGFEIQCGECGAVLPDLEEYDYCPWCGQAIDWSEVF